MANIDGTPGDDFLEGTDDPDTINGFGGNDQVIGYGGDDTLDGGDGHDLIYGFAGNDFMYGGSGDDFLRGYDGDDYLDGGDGIDRVSYADATTGVTVDLNTQGVAQNTGWGMDTLVGIESVSGSAFDDIITGNSGDNWLWGGSNGSGVSGNDTISGGDGNDLIEVGGGNHALDGGSGTDSLSLFGNATDTAGGVTVDLNQQGAAQDSGQGMMLLSGFENLSGSIHADTLTGDAGDNWIGGDQGGDSISGGDGNDMLYGDGRAGVDSHGTGGSGPITFYDDVADIDPSLVGGDDVLEGGLGDDIIDGGQGSDTASYEHSAGAVEAGLYDGGLGEAFGADGYDQLYNVENLTGSAFDDVLLGNDEDNVLTGLGGHDFLYGYGGNDSLIGGDGDDFLRGYAGDDLLDGGAGIDRVSYYDPDSTSGVTVDLNLQGSAQDTGHGMDTLTGIEHVSGTIYDDVLTGDSGDNWIWGGSDGTGSGITGNDIISAGGGNDVMSGSQGGDSFVIEADSGDDVVTDFSKSQDVIVFDVAGVEDFGDLTLTASGSHDTLITWGTGDSLLLEGVKPNQLDASAFDFGALAATAAADPGLFG